MTVEKQLLTTEDRIVRIQQFIIEIQAQVIRIERLRRDIALILLDRMHPNFVKMPND